MRRASERKAAEYKADEGKQQMLGICVGLVGASVGCRLGVGGICVGHRLEGGVE